MLFGWFSPNAINFYEHEISVSGGKLFRIAPNRRQPGKWNVEKLNWDGFWHVWISLLDKDEAIKRAKEYSYSEELLNEHIKNKPEYF